MNNDFFDAYDEWFKLGQADCVDRILGELPTVNGETSEFFAKVVPVDELPTEARARGNHQYDLAALQLRGKAVSGRWRGVGAEAFIVVENQHGLVYPSVRGEFSLRTGIGHAALTAEVIRTSACVASCISEEMEAANGRA